MNINCDLEFDFNHGIVTENHFNSFGVTLETTGPYCSDIYYYFTKFIPSFFYEKGSGWFYPIERFMNE